MNFLEAIIMRLFILFFYFFADQPTAQQVVKNYVDVIGGQEALETIQTITYVRELDRGNEKQRNRRVYYQKRPLSPRTPSLDSVAGPLVNVESPWMAGGETSPCFTRLESWDRPTGGDGDIISSLAHLVDYERSGMSLELVETVRLQSVAYHHVKMTRPRGEEQELYFDAHTGLLVWFAPNANTTVWVSDYRKVGGLLIPYRSEARGTSHDGRAWHHVDTLIDIELRGSIDHCSFQAKLT